LEGYDVLRAERVTYRALLGRVSEAWGALLARANEANAEELGLAWAAITAALAAKETT